MINIIIDHNYSQPFVLVIIGVQNSTCPLAFASKLSSRVSGIFSIFFEVFLQFKHLNENFQQ